MRRDPTSPGARHHRHARLPEDSGRRGHGGGKLTLATFILDESAGRVSEDQKSWWRPGGHRGPWASPTTNTPKTTWGTESVTPPCIAISMDIYAKTGKQKAPPPAPDVKSLPGTSASKKTQAESLSNTELRQGSGFPARICPKRQSKPVQQ